MENELMHFGVKGMRWGVRRYQNKDGTLIRSKTRRKIINCDDASVSRDVVFRNDFYNEKYNL